jgi:hypothetical protein
MIEKLFSRRTNQFHIFSYLIILLVLGGAYYFGKESDLRIVGFLLVLVFGIVLLRHPVLGLGILIFSALLVPFEIGTGTQTSINIAVIMTILLLGLLFISRLAKRQPLINHSFLLPPVIVFAIISIIAFLNGNIIWHPDVGKIASLPAQLGGLAVFLLTMGAILLTGNQVITTIQLKRIAWVFLGTGSIYILGKMIPSIAHWTSNFFLNGSTGSLFWIWLVALAGGQVLFNKDLPRPAWIGLWALVLATLGVGLKNNSWASGWIPPLGAFVVLIWLRSWKWGMVIVLSGLILLFFIKPDIIPYLLNQDNYSIVTRQAAWKIVLVQAMQYNPILGFGPANYTFYTPYSPIMGYYVKFNSHNQYVDLIAQIGILGLLAYGWLCLKIGLLGFRLRAMVKDGFTKGYVNACIAGLAGILAAGMISDYPIPYVYNIGIAGFRSSVLGWLFLGGLAAIEHILATKSQDGT